MAEAAFQRIYFQAVPEISNMDIHENLVVGQSARMPGFEALSTFLLDRFVKRPLIL